ncbi:hypothetical protein [Rhodovibrio sodomensis]|uniref:hypothetical protein n=1 Tax=Rhodovibrio sodomensis TaxID=1088 RepID=UPI0034615150
MLAFLVVLPRLRHRSGSDPLFWGAVARRTQPENYLAEICDRCGHAGACQGDPRVPALCPRKFRLLRAALLCAAAGVLLFLAALAVGLPLGGLQAGVS